MRNFTLLCATTALVMPAMAFAQSTGSIEVEEEAEALVVTGTRVRGIEGIVVPDGTKARQVLTNEYLLRQEPGQTVLDALNIIPGVNFTQSDAYGSAGGNIRIRGFDGNRISLTFDGFPLNDTGNYAIFSNQQLDPELIDEVNVNLGATDIDSPTASAAGGTINYRTIVPSRTLSGRVAASYGEDDYNRIFGLIETGDLTSFGTRGFIAASSARNDKFKGPGDIYKQQYNAGIYQPLGSNGDFARLSVHYNQNRNNFYRNPSVTDLRGLFGATIVPANTAINAANPLLIGGFDRAQRQAILGFENLGSCTKTVGGPGAQNDNGGRLPTGNAANTAPAIAGSANNNIENTSSCTNFYELRINPSNTGNARFNSRYTLSDALTLTLDGSYQYVLANGGGNTAIAENNIRVRGGTPGAPGVDYNGDGDFLDTIRFYTPNNTNTNRYTATASLIYDITEQHRVRVSYTFDRGRHRQTGEWGFLDAGGRPQSVFGGRNADPVLTADGFQFQQRDRLSIALLNQVSGEYIGKFAEDRLTVQLGLRAPFFKRTLNQFCYTEARGSGFAYCTSEPASSLRIIGPNDVVPATGGAIPYYAPFRQVYKFDDILPNVGATFDITEELNVFGSYARGFSAPRTDNLYRAPVVDVEPETTDSFDLGARYTSRVVQAYATAWFIGYQNRIVSSFNPDLGISLDRNIGKVESYGLDASVTVRPIDWLSLTAFGSYTHTEIKDNIPLTGTTFAPTAGKRVPETPEYQFGGRAAFEFGPVEFGIEGKWVDERFATDVNDVVVDDYATVDLDVRYSLESLGLNETFVQLNVKNLFNEFYFGNISTQIDVTGGPNFTVGAPRTIVGSLQIGF